jgi:glutaredoxin
MTLILYTTDCPKCKILKHKLDDKGIKYETCSDVNIMQEKGFRSVPMLQIDENIMTYLDAIKWIKEQTI